MYDAWEMDGRDDTTMQIFNFFPFILSLAFGNKKRISGIDGPEDVS